MPLIRAPCQPTCRASTCGNPILSGSETPCCRRTWAAHSSCPVGAISERVPRPWHSPSDVPSRSNGSYYRLRDRRCFPLVTQAIHFVPSLLHPRTDLRRTSGDALSGCVPPHWLPNYATRQTIVSEKNGYPSPKRTVRPGVQPVSHSHPVYLLFGRMRGRRGARDQAPRPAPEPVCALCAVAASTMSAPLRAPSPEEDDSAPLLLRCIVSRYGFRRLADYRPGGPAYRDEIQLYVWCVQYVQLASLTATGQLPRSARLRSCCTWATPSCRTRSRRTAFGSCSTTRRPGGTKHAARW